MLVCFFLEHGIQFYTLAPMLTKGARNGWLPEPCQLPEEPVGHGYTITDFYEYEKHCEEFLNSPYGHIVGGLLPDSGGRMFQNLRNVCRRLIWVQPSTRFSKASVYVVGKRNSMTTS